MKKKIIMLMTLAMALTGCGIMEPAAPSGNTSAATEAAAEKETEAATEAETDAATDAATEAATEAGTEKASETAAPATEAAARTETVAGTDAPAAEASESAATAADEASSFADPFEGSYRESLSGRCVITLKNNGHGYDGHIHWSSSASECSEWDFSGEFNGRQVLYYNDCTRAERVYTEDGSYTETIITTNGTGYIRIAEEGEHTGLTWVDDNDDSGAQYFYEKEDTPVQ